MRFLLRCTVPLLALGLLAGCSDDDDDAPRDTGSGDTMMPDTDMPDTAMPDADMPDTAMPDADMPETTVPDADMPDEGPETTDPPTLFEQLGGEPAIRAVVSGLLTNVLANDEINWMFVNTDGAQLGQLLYEQICAATGGGCTYTGRSMAEAHEGMAITTAQFNALVGDLLAALDTLDVPYTAGTFDGGLPADTLLTALAGMAPDIIEDADGDEILFNQLGGYAAVGAVIDGLLTNVAADERINGFFADTDLPNLRRLLVEQVCAATGGFCVYTGRTMRESHAGLGITDDDFNALVEDLLAALDSLSVPYTAGTFDGDLPADALITALAGMRGDIVNVPAAE